MLDPDKLNADRKRLEAIAFKIVKDSHVAEDLAAETIVEAWAETDIIKNPSSWMARVVKNKALDWLRSFSVPTVDEFHEVAPEPPEEVDVMRIETVLKQMPMELRLALTGADKTGSVSTRRRRLIEARAEFKRLWELDD